MNVFIKIRTILNKVESTGEDIPAELKSDIELLQKLEQPLSDDMLEELEQYKPKFTPVHGEAFIKVSGDSPILRFHDNLIGGVVFYDSIGMIHVNETIEDFVDKLRASDCKVIE